MIKLKHSGMARLLKSGEVERLLMRLAAKVETVAKAAAPVRTGAYRDSIHTEAVDHPTRKVARVAAGVDYGWVVEANTGNLARALDAAR
jgi:hypothetical protein